MFTANKDVVYSDTQLRVAFDGDAVIFSDESEQIFKEQGLDRFFEHEKLNENKPLAQVCISLISFLKGVSKRSDDFHCCCISPFPQCGYVLSESWCPYLFPSSKIIFKMHVSHKRCHHCSHFIRPSLQSSYFSEKTAYIEQWLTVVF